MGEWVNINEYSDVHLGRNLEISAIWTITQEQGLIKIIKL